MTTTNKPNVIVIYCDDLGYGDISCYGSTAIQTPNIDKLIENGVKFCDGYSTSAVCTPARYSLLTGEYPFRNPDTKILPGNAPCLISKECLTLPKVFKKAGYNTAVVGKWHLGLGNNDIDWNKELSHTPNDVGFDYSFIFPATADRVPCVYVKNRLIENLEKDDPIEVSYYTKENPYGIETGKDNPEKLRMMYHFGHCDTIVNGVSRIGYMKGGKKATWRDEDLAERFLGEAKNFVSENKDNNFFLYYALHQPHVPRVPNEKFVGKTNLGPRGDVIAELDWCVGQLREHLEKENLLDNTIIIFSSDNGPVLDDGYFDNSFELNSICKHKPAGPLRGGKYSKFEGGTRVPFIVSWQSHIKPQTSNALVCQVDLLASFAQMLGVEIEKDTDARDSLPMIETLLGDSHKSRKEIVAESGNKSCFIRQGKWTYLQPSEGQFFSDRTQTELGHTLSPQLYNMDYDIGQQDDVAQYHKDIVEKMNNRLNEVLQSKMTR